jgi:hypothetical protein
MVIGSICPISVEGVIRRLRWGIGLEGGKALSSHHIWPIRDVHSARPSVGQNLMDRCTFGQMDGQTDRWTDGVIENQQQNRPVCVQGCVSGWFLQRVTIAKKVMQDGKVVWKFLSQNMCQSHSFKDAYRIRT